jgi:hypothetical protein
MIRQGWCQAKGRSRDAADKALDDFALGSRLDSADVDATDWWHLFFATERLHDRIATDQWQRR